jgi:hypothetical protein
MKEEEDKMLNKITTLHPRLLQQWRPLRPHPNPKTLTDQEEKERGRRNPKWYARSHPKMATPHNGVPPLLL